MAMRVEVVQVPRELRPEHLIARAVVVLDVLRATTSIVSALAAGASEVRVFESIDAVRAAAASGRGEVLMCGEVHCLRPDGFDLGNSPGEFTAPRVAGRAVLLSTTNGTRALLAARSAERLYAAALVNASATADALADEALDVTLLCSGTDDAVAMEDLLGAGAILHALRQRIAADPQSDVARIALHLFAAERGRLPAVLRQTLGGRNIRDAGLEADIDFAAQLDALPIVAAVDGRLVITRRPDPHAAHLAGMPQ